MLHESFHWRISSQGVQQTEDFFPSFFKGQKKSSRSSGDQGLLKLFLRSNVFSQPSKNQNLSKAFYGQETLSKSSRGHRPEKNNSITKTFQRPLCPLIIPPPFPHITPNKRDLHLNQVNEVKNCRQIKNPHTHTLSLKYSAR